MATATFSEKEILEHIYDLLSKIHVLLERRFSDELIRLDEKVGNLEKNTESILDRIKKIT